jgi:hypothetical protein
MVQPGELPGAISVIPSPEDPLPIGIASEVGRVGGSIGKPIGTWGRRKRSGDW